MSKMKYLHATALLALCVLVMAGTALAQDSWRVIADDFPTGLWWDQEEAVSVDTENDGTTTWQTTWALTSVDGVTPSAIVTDRWGMSAVPVAGPVPPTNASLEGLYDFDFDIVAPPIVGLRYAPPITPTSQPQVAPFDCNWYLANGTGTLVTTDISENEITVNRFWDILPGTGALGESAAPWIAELAGRVPAIVGGYGGGIYAPNLPVDRAGMAVFIARAINLELEDYEGRFPSDVPSTQWAWPWIEAMARAGLVSGTGTGAYSPDGLVNRDAMAMFVARGMVGSAAIPAGPDAGHFVDVPDATPGPAHWAYNGIEYCYGNNVVGGFGGGIYSPGPLLPGDPLGPGNPVSRAHMAIFVYRGFIHPTGTAVVLAGPAVTPVDTTAAEYDGWSSAAVGEADDPGTAYIALDAVRLDSDMAPLEVKFELRGAATPTVPATGEYTATVTLTSDDIDNAQAAAGVDGNPYLYVTWEIPEGLEEDDYVLVVSVGGVEVARKPAFTIGPIPEPPALEEVVRYMSSGLDVDPGSLVSGSYADLAADDDSYVVGTSRAADGWLRFTVYGSDAGLVPADILKVKIDVIAQCTVAETYDFSVISSGASGATTWCTDLLFPDADTDSHAVYESANKAKIADIINAVGGLRMILACCCEQEPGSYTVSVDLVKYTFTMKP